jgi:hypothetical protein
MAACDLTFARKLQKGLLRMDNVSGDRNINNRKAAAHLKLKTLNLIHDDFVFLRIHHT